MSQYQLQYNYQDQLKCFKLVTKTQVMAYHSPTCGASKIAEGKVNEGGEDHSGTTLSQMTCLVQNKGLVMFEDASAQGFIHESYDSRQCTW